MAEIDIWRARRTDAEALRPRRRRSFRNARGQVLDQGGTEGFGMWTRVVAAINELDRATPRNGETRH